LAIITIFLVLLLLYKPKGSRPQAPAEDKHVSKYLTHVLSPEFYNGLQRNEPFKLVVSQSGINDIIAHSKWPREYDGICILAPKVFFAADNVVLMGTVTVKGVEIAVTIVIEPVFNQDGLLIPKAKQVKIGALSITPLARVIASGIYNNQLEDGKIDPADPGAKIAASLLNNEPFEPILDFDGKKIRIEKIGLTIKQLTLSFVPAD